MVLFPPKNFSSLPIEEQRHLIAHTVASLPSEQARELAGMIKRAIEEMHYKH